MFNLFRSTVNIAHGYLKTVVKPGGVAVDATVGNGSDTLFLAGLVGLNGRVYGFDIQPEAIRRTTEAVIENGYSELVKLFEQGHENMGDFINEPVDAVVFNLGYLPGGDHNIVTAPETTLTGVIAGLNLLKPGGVMCIVMYTGHSGGPEEQERLESYLRHLDKKLYYVCKIDFLNRNKAPFLLVVEKASEVSMGGLK
ncbi:class I SAM-dependent methyltransferase [Phosphitispora fastidiosa]|uniref:class I SAM-dependent methyltransferase n=1 Tax=Phosphitispora fastidiosa TaxID=2837202 RepID=UPI001E454E35|nr:class I SAM-dependent methyltransferase [Phosphitispora fastidiosa]MBU7007670.1 putative methyltransferase [Phosphitispora fastidiosa]